VPETAGPHPAYNTAVMRYARYVLLAVLLLQIPFVYQVCQTAQVESFTGEVPRVVTPRIPFLDLKGTVHVHSAAGGHSLGTYPEMITAAKKAGYRYLFITEHPRDIRLFNPIEDPELILVYGWEREDFPNGHTLEDEDSTVRIYSEFEGDYIPEEVTGIEIYSLDENARAGNTPFGWLSFLYHHFGYLDLFFFHLWEIDRERIELWERQLENRILPGFAGNDAHQNVGLILQTAAGQKIFSVLVDPYERSFRFVSNHLLIPKEREPDRETVLQALRTGSSYIAFDQISDPNGFAFYARRGRRTMPMGSTVPTGTELVVQAPLLSLFRVIRPHGPDLELEGSYFVIRADRPGPYRVEVYPRGVPSLLEDKPWILSNPIYVREPGDARD